MKKILFVLILLLICIFSFNVFAEETGKLIVKSGDGTKLGDEACLGDQCFYVIENDGETAKLLSKYNLYNGWVYQYEDIYQETTNSSESSTRCYRPYSGMTDGCWKKFFEQTGLSEDTIATNGYEDAFDYEELNDNGKVFFRMYYFTKLENTEFKQNSEAIGAHGNEIGEPEFPEIAVFNFFNSNFHWWISDDLEYGGSSSDYKKDGEKYSNYFQDYNFKRDIIQYDGDNEIGVLNSYEEYLDNQGLNIEDINILSLTDLNNIVKTAKGSYLPLDSWGENRKWIEASNGHEGYYVYGSLKEELDNNYSWLWATTYWLRTYDYRTTENTKLVFVDTLGYVCSDGWCQVVGAGVRPVIEVDAKDIVKPKQEIIVNPETGGIALLVIAGICGLLYGVTKTKKKLS